MNRRSLSLLSLVLATATGLGSWLLHTRTAPASIEAPAAASTTSNTAQPSGPGARAGGPRLGTALTYALRASSATTLGVGRPDAATIDVAMAGKYTVTGAERDGELTHLRVALSLDGPPSARAQGRSGDPEKVGAMAAALERPFYVSIDTRGRVVRLHFEHQVDPMSRGLLRGIATASQSVVELGEAWTVEESDATGRYLAAYHRIDEHRLEKTKTRYLHVGPAGRETNALELPSVEARTDIELGDDGALVKLASDERLRMGGGQEGLPPFASRLELALDRVGETFDATAVGAYTRDRERLDSVEVDGAPDGGGDRAAADRRMVAGASYRELVGALGARRDDPRGRASTQARLSALFRLDDAAIASAGTALVAGRAGPDSDAIIAALGGAGTPEAQGALVDVIDSAAAGPVARMQAAVNAGLVTEPTPETAEALARIAADPATSTDLRGPSTLALGTVAGRLRASDAAAATDALDQLLERLSAAKSPDERALLLRAIGNAGDARALPALQVALADGDDWVRAAAAEALRFVPDPSVDGVIDALLVSDPAEQVRRSALYAAGFRTVDVHVKALARVLGRDRSPMLRSEAVKLLSGVVSRSEVARHALATAADSDASADVRRLAAAALGA